MTITIDVFEIQHFEERVRFWHDQRLTYITETRVEPAGTTGVPTEEWTPLLKCDPEIRRELLDQWDSLHAFPRLLPLI